jgi:hypothetical protein
VFKDHIPNVGTVPRLHVNCPPQPSAHAAAPSPADSDDEVPILHFSHHTALVPCYGDNELPLPAPVFLAFPPPLLLFALILPCRLAAAADALSGMVNSDLLLLPPLPAGTTSTCLERSVA